VALNRLERRVVDDIADRVEDLVTLVSDLIAFDTTARAFDDPPRDEAPLQRHLAGELERHGAEIDLWEPQPEDVELPRMLPPGLRFDGRPQLAARFAGAGGGRSLLFNGHVDVVSAEPRDQWTSDPNVAVVRDGRLYGRGACDMKGGVGAMTFAATALARAGVRLRGDLVVCTTTDEESFGAGGVAAVRRGVQADAAIVTEASGGDVWYACRGSLNPRLVVEGRTGHAGVHQRHWRQGGALNAIHKTTYLLDGLRRLEEEWRTRADSTHPDLGPTDCVPTTIAGGDWFVSHPASCVTTLHIAYVPGMADADGWGSRVEAEVEQAVATLAAADSWLAEHPPRLEWTYDVPPSAIDPAAPVCTTALGAVADVGWQGRPAGTDFWHDGATFALLGGMPVVCLGPGAIDAAHTVDEHVAVDELVRCAQALAVTAMRFCGTA
jgi:acetylornithine deacetylase